MTTYKSKTQSTSGNGYETFLKGFKNNTLPNLVFLFGPEGYLIDWCKGKILEKEVAPEYQAFNYTKLDGNTLDVSTFINSCETLPMLGDKKVVSLEGLGEINGKSIGPLKGKELEAFLAYLDKIPETTHVIIPFKNRIDTRSSFFKKVQSRDGTFKMDRLNKSLLEKWILKKLSQNKINIRTHYLEKLIQRTGYYHKESNYTLYDLDQDLNKIIMAALEAGEVGEALIDTYIEGDIENDIFKLLDVISKGDKEKALARLNDLLYKGVEPGFIFHMINGQLSEIMYLKLLSKKGGAQNELIKQYRAALNSKKPDFAIRNLINTGANLSELKMNTMLNGIRSIEKQKKQFLIDDKLGLELFISIIM